MSEERFCVFEIRWLSYKDDAVLKKKLQYRVRTSVTNYSPSVESKEHTKELKWSEWKDVPTVNEWQTGE